MKDKLANPWAQSPADQRREPAGSELSAGFACGPADRELFNELMYRLSGAEAEIIKVITEAGIVPDEFDLTQLWQALNLHFMKRFEDEVPGAGEIILTDLEPDTYYMVYLTSNNIATSWSVQGSTDNGVSWRTDYQNTEAIPIAYSVAGAQTFAAAGDLDLFSFWTGTASRPALFYQEVASWFAFRSSEPGSPRTFVNAPTGPVSGIRITTDADLKIAAQKVM